jgi:hypothetical protein
MIENCDFFAGHRVNEFAEQPVNGSNTKTRLAVAQGLGEGTPGQPPILGRLRPSASTHPYSPWAAAAQDELCLDRRFSILLLARPHPRFYTAISKRLAHSTGSDLTSSNDAMTCLSQISHTPEYAGQSPNLRGRVAGKCATGNGG